MLLFFMVPSSTLYTNNMTEQDSTLYDTKLLYNFLCNSNTGNKMHDCILLSNTGRQFHLLQLPINYKYIDPYT